MTGYLERAEYFQRQGLTLTEISERIGADRSFVVDLLYTRKVRPMSVPPEVETTKRQYAGKHA